jgi:hypothetical protein
MRLSVKSPELVRVLTGESRNFKGNFLYNHAAKNFKKPLELIQKVLILWAFKQNIHLVT